MAELGCVTRHLERVCLQNGGLSFAKSLIILIVPIASILNPIAISFN